MILDLFILIVVVAAAIKGYFSGFIAQAGQVAGIVAALLVCRLFGDTVLGMVGSDEPTATTAVCVYGIMAVGTYIGVWMLVRLVRSAWHAVKLGFIDSLGGAAFGIVEWGLALSLVLNVVASQTEEPIRDDSKPWRGVVLDAAPTAFGFLSEINDSELNVDQI